MSTSNETKTNIRTTIRLKVVIVLLFNLYLQFKTYIEVLSCCCKVAENFKMVTKHVFR